mgnify:CR=1 FL=1
MRWLPQSRALANNARKKPKKGHQIDRKARREADFATRAVGVDQGARDASKRTVECARQQAHAAMAAQRRIVPRARQASPVGLICERMLLLLLLRLVLRLCRLWLQSLRQLRDLRSLLNHLHQNGLLLLRLLLRLCDSGRHLREIERAIDVVLL